MMGGISLEALIMIVVAIVGATIWIVNSIDGVRDEVRGMRIALEKDVDALRNELHDHINDTDAHSYQ